MKNVTLMQAAFLVAQESKCLSYKVGCVIAKDGRIISTGYNGTIAGADNPDEYAVEQGWTTEVDGKVYLLKGYRDMYSKWGADNIIHAEQNALLFAAKNGSAVNGATMFCTLSPCGQCMKMIASAGIRVLYYCEEYPASAVGWADYLRKHGVDVIQLPRKSLKMLDWDKVSGKQKKYPFE